MKYIKIQDGRLLELDEKEDKKEIEKYSNNTELYTLRNNDTAIFDLDKQEIKHYTKYLIKGMEGSRELPAIIINRFIQITILIMLLFTLYQLSQKPNIDKIKEVINNGGQEKNIIEKITNRTQSGGIQKPDLIINKK